MAGWEIILALALLGTVCFTQWLMRSPSQSSGHSQSPFLVWIAQGFGIGRIPIAPGTFGSIIGLAWFALLLAPGRLWTLLLGIVVGLALSVWLCGVAEKELRQKDPGSVVLDEITAVPVCFLATVGFAAWKSGSLPDFGYFLCGHRWLWIVVVFAAFRLFDVLKPWPVRQSQSLPGGWGITIDDVLAALYVNLVVILIESGKAILASP
jgi:phosphatidylglycerophosphatase A